MPASSFSSHNFQERFSTFMGKKIEVINVTNVTATSVDRVALRSSSLPVHTFPAIPHC